MDSPSDSSLGVHRGLIKNSLHQLTSFLYEFEE